MAESLDAGCAIEVADLRKVYRGVVAVDGVSFSVERGQSLAIVGESGSGKTTVARCLIGLERPSAGTIRVLGDARGDTRVSSRERRRRARQVQIVFQDPYGSLDPSQRVGKCLDEVLAMHFSLDHGERRARVADLLERVGLSAATADMYPRALSGGQRQRIAIARALAAGPAIVILDEAVAALDVSVQAQVLNLLADIREESGISYIFISHDLAVVRQVSDSVLVMHRGVVIERGTTGKVLSAPTEPYTQRLIASIPRVQ